MKSKDACGAALEAVLAQDLAAALDSLLDAWRQSPHEPVAERIGALGAELGRSS